MTRRLPRIEELDGHFLPLARMVAKTSWLPNPQVVKLVARAVFPTVRDIRRRFQTFTNAEGEPIGMYDDNHTPKWALLWSHGIVGGSRKGWAFSHVWTCSDDVAAYTHVANMIMVPEAFASLTDKSGPLTGFLRWHAWQIYHWKPSAAAEPQKPLHYDEIEWQYFEPVVNPWELIHQRLSQLNNERVRVLRPIMEKRATL